MAKPKFLAKIINSESRWPFIVVAALISAVVILTSGVFAKPDESTYTLSQHMSSQYNVVKARVIDTDDSALVDEPFINGMKIGVQKTTVEIIRGNHRGEVYDINNTMNRVLNIHLKPDMTFLCMVQETDGEVQRVDVYGYNRDMLIYGLVTVFVLVVLLVGRKKGIYSLASLAFTMIIVIFFLIPRIMEGHNPILMAIVTAALTTVATMFIVSGCNSKSVSAIAGIVIGVIASGVVSVIAGRLGHISGINAQEAEEMIYLAQDIPLKVPELFFAGIIVSALGAIMDIGISISSTVFEVRAANPKLGMSELYKSGMNVGRDTIGTMTNTLILAFAGSSMAVMIIIAMYRLPFLRMINLNMLGLEVIQGISGSIGLIITVPVTALCAAFFASAGSKKKLPIKPDVKSGSKKR